MSRQVAHNVFLICLCLIICPFLIVGCGGGGGGANDTDDTDDNTEPPEVVPLPVTNPLSGLITDTRNLPAPEWVKTGTRMIFYGAAARLMPPVKQAPEPMEWASGSGYSVVDVVSLTADTVVLNYNFYVEVTIGSQPRHAGFASYIGPPACGSNLYVHPTLLKQLIGIYTNDVQVTENPAYVLNGVTYGIIDIAVKTENGYVTYTYEADTGILLVNSVKANAVTQAQTQWRATRQLSLPWANYKTPAVINDIDQLRYEGTYTTTMPGTPQAPGLPVWATMQLTQVGGNWVEYAYLDSSMLTGFKLMLVSGSAQIGGLWVHPDALDQLAAGQMIDDDTVINVTTSVDYVGPLDNRDVVVIKLEMPQNPGDYYQTYYYYYDQNTGLLYRVRLEDLVFPTLGTLQTTDQILVEQ